MLIGGMKNGTHNDNDTWQTLAAATARVVLKLEKQHREERPDDGAEDQRDERDPKAHDEYVERRLQELAQFEARTRGGRGL